jgi:hypothetical protein
VMCVFSHWHLQWWQTSDFLLTRTEAAHSAHPEVSLLPVGHALSLGEATVSHDSASVPAQPEDSELIVQCGSGCDVSTQILPSSLPGHQEAAADAATITSGLIRPRQAQASSCQWQTRESVFLRRRGILPVPSLDLTRRTLQHASLGPSHSGKAQKTASYDASVAIVIGANEYCNQVRPSSTTRSRRSGGSVSGVTFVAFGLRMSPFRIASSQLEFELEPVQPADCCSVIDCRRSSTVYQPLQRMHKRFGTYLKALMALTLLHVSLESKQRKQILKLLWIPLMKR